MKNNDFKYKLFGRFKGRKKISNYNLDNLYKYNNEIKINKNNYNILDIGSGSGENAIQLATLYPQSKIITCELFEDGNINLHNSIIKNNIKNISIFQGNVLEFLDNLESSFLFDEVWILFPDPWPKQRHHKRRLINSVFLNLIHLFLKKTGKLMIASDSPSYIESILKTICDVQDIFLWTNQSYDKWNYKNLNLPETKFYKKALKNDRNSMFFQLNKI